MSPVDRFLAALRESWFSETRTDIAVVALSAVVVYLAALAIVRTGKKRFMGQNSVFDVILGFILGTTLARAINGNAPLASTMAAGFVLVGLHWIFSLIASKSRWFGLVVKGGNDAVMDDGEFVPAAMAKHHVTEHDLQEAARLHGVESLDDVKTAHFERNGKLSIVPKFRSQIVDVRVEEGVQTVSIKVWV